MGNLLDAANECRKDSDYKGEVQRFMARALTECLTIQDKVLSGKWKPMTGHSRWIHERGKPRLIVPPTFATRVAERCFCDQVFAPFVEQHSIKDSGACLKGRGPHKTRERLREQMEAAPMSAWVFQYDFHNFFGSIDRTLALEMLERYLKPEFVQFISAAIGGPGIGVNLGSAVSQHIATWYPTERIDLPLLRFEGTLGYSRYMDDAILITETKDQALNAMAKTIEWASILNLQMNPKKTHCNRITHPHIFLQCRFTKRRSGVRMTAIKANTKRNIRHARNVVRKAETTDIDLQAMKASCAGHLDRADNKLSHLLDERITWPD